MLKILSSAQHTSNNGLSANMSSSHSIAINLLLGLLSSAMMADAITENRAHVKLAPGVDPSYLKQYGSATPLFTLPYETLKKLSAAEPGLPDLTLWYEVKTEPSLFGVAMGAFQGLDEDVGIHDFFFLPVDAPPPPQARRRVQFGTPDFGGNQGYLYQNMPGNNGIDAEYSWTFEGGNGEGINIYDIEYSWNVNHEDLSASIPSIVSPGDMASDPFNNLNHGTAVLGELVGSNNGLGVKGISHGAQAKVVPEWTIKGGWNRADAILRAVINGKPGDVILLEMQIGACGGACSADQIGCGPAEEDPTVFETTKVAVANKFVVVAAAGNGNVNLDDPRCMGKYDRTNPNRDSGAIIVGAGGSGVPAPGCSPARQKMSFSTYGSRVDVHGWGECVMTTGYGNGYTNPTNPTDQNKWYTGVFTGTSSATPFVAAVAANIQGIAMKRFGSPLEPKAVRELLTETGLSQTGSSTDGRIGPLVNLRNAIDKLLPLPPPASLYTAPITNMALSGRSIRHYYLDVTAGQNVSCSTNGPNGDADLYLRFGSEAVPDSGFAGNACSSTSDLSMESCSTVAPSGSTRVYAAVHAWAAFSGLAFQCTKSTAPSIYTAPITNMALSGGSIRQYYLDVTAGQTVSCSTNGPNGDADLYLRFGFEAVPDSGFAGNACSSTSDLSMESCSTVAASGSTRVYAAVHAWAAFSGLTFQCTKGTAKPTTRKPSTRKPTSRKPTTRKPTTRKPTTRKPTK